MTSEVTGGIMLIERGEREREREGWLDGFNVQTRCIVLEIRRQISID